MQPASNVIVFASGLTADLAHPIQSAHDIPVGSRGLAAPHIPVFPP
jgi:hypothetical protein